MAYESSEHIDETLLGRFALNDPTLGEQREDIAFHLRTCEGCTERFQELKEYYTEVQSLVHSHEQALVTTERVLPGPRNDTRHQVGSIPRWNPVARILSTYPKASSVGVVGLIAAALFLLLQPAHRDTNPSSVLAKEGFLTVSNKAGEVLFRKKFYPEFDLQAIQLTRGSVLGSQDHHFTAVDVDGDGTNEVLLELGWGEAPERNSILCFNSDGSERWRFQFNRSVKLGGESVTDDYVCRYFSVKDFDNDGRMDIVTIFRHSTYSPSVLVRLDASTGTLRSEYWHAGWLYQIGELSTPNNPITKIVLGGVNNGLRLADLLVLDPRSLSGQAPTSADFMIPTLGKGSQEHYVTFPRNGPEHLVTRPYNETSVLNTTGNHIVVFVSEQFERNGYAVAIVQFDYNMNIVALTPHDDFRGYLERLRKSGITTVKTPEEYFAGFRSGIRFWNGTAFVSESKIQALPPLLP